MFAGVRLPEIKETVPLERRYPRLSEVVIDLAKVINTFFFLLFLTGSLYYGDLIFSFSFLIYLIFSVNSFL